MKYRGLLSGMENEILSCSILRSDLIHKSEATYKSNLT